MARVCTWLGIGLLAVSLMAQPYLLPEVDARSNDQTKQVDGTNQPLRLQTLVAALAGAESAPGQDLNDDGQVDVLDFQRAVYEGSQPESKGHEPNRSEDQAPPAAVAASTQTQTLKQLTAIYLPVESSSPRAPSRRHLDGFILKNPIDVLLVSSISPHAPPSIA